MTAVYPTLRAHLPLVLGAVVLLLIVTERTVLGAAAGLASFAAAAALGWATLDLTPAAPLAAGGMLTPLFAGLFGAPVLIDALDGAGVPEQADPTVTSSPRAVFAMAAAGALAGAVVGYLPGISSAIAAVAVLTLTPGGAGDRGYVVATSGVNTANTLFALFALVAIRQPRTGVLVAFDEVAAPLNLPLLVGTAMLASVAGFCLVLSVGDRYLRVVGQADYRRLSIGVLTLLVALSWLFAGGTGIAVFAVSAALGLVPVRLGARRVHLMGVLIGPLALGV
jgi:putative membrane protein